MKLYLQHPALVFFSKGICWANKMGPLGNGPMTLTFTVADKIFNTVLLLRNRVLIQ
jgi:hypothetical protein